jgi:hypothetical protein
VVVRDLLHPLTTTEPIEQTGVTEPLQLSVAVALPQPGIEPGLQPKSEPDGHDVNAGGVASTTSIVRQQMTCPSSHVIVSHIVKEPGQVTGIVAVTEMVALVEEPVPLPVTAQ